MDTIDKIEKIDEILRKWEAANSHLYDMKKLFAEVKEELKLTEFNVAEEVYANVSKHHEYVTRHFSAKNHYSELKRYEKILEKLLYHYYKYEFAHKLRTAQEIERHVQAHDTWQLLDKLLKNVTHVIDYLGIVDKLFTERNYAIGNVSRLLGS